MTKNIFKDKKKIVEIKYQNLYEELSKKFRSSSK